MNMKPCIAVVATMDTKGDEARFLREEIEALGGSALLIDIGVMDEPTVPVDIDRREVVAAGGGDFDALMAEPTRAGFNPSIVRGASQLLLDRITAGEVHAVLSMGGTQGTSSCSQIMQTLPYGVPKVILSTAASGDTSPFVDIKDITMMFSVSDILGLNPFSRKILANAAGAAFGMALTHERRIEPEAGCKGLIGMTNLGVLTKGAMHAIDLFHEAGYEVITFHAIGAGGRAMEQMAREGLLAGIFDYALGDIADWCYDALRAADEDRLTVAGELGLPQVVCPGGTEHLGILVHEENHVPEEYSEHIQVFHSPYVFVPRLRSEEFVKVAREITKRLETAREKTVFALPLQGVSRYSIPGGVLREGESDAAFFECLRETMPAPVRMLELDHGAEDDAFVEVCVRALIELIEG
jgi:uncharacterized protein (UPF0261 family)